MKRFAWFSALVVLMGGFVPNAEAVVIRFVAHLDGPSENPPVASPGTGLALVTYDSVAHLLNIEATFEDLVGTTTVAHIHCCVDPPGTVGVATFPATFPGFPVGVTSGTYVSPSPIDLLDTSSFTTSFLNTFGGGTAAGAEAALLAGMQGGRAYFNIHTSFANGGEIRGFLQQVPEPGALGLFALGMVSALAARRRARGSLTHS